MIARLANHPGFATLIDRASNGRGVMRTMHPNDDDRPRASASPRNGNRLPLCKPGERIGGRKKGTPNKMSRDLKEAIIAAGHEPGIRLSKPGPLYSPPPSPDEQLEYLVWLALNNPHIYARLLGRL